LKSIFQEKKTEEENLLFGLKIVAICGLTISALILIYKQLLQPDIGNIIADSFTVLMFAGIFFSVANKKVNQALNMVFFIPLLIYLYYLAEFSNSAPPADTIFFTLWWFIAGTVVLAYFSSINFRFVLFLTSGLVTLIFHLTEADMMERVFSINQTYATNPLLILWFVFAAASLIRASFDKRFRKTREEKLAVERQMNETFQTVKQPLAQICAERDQDGNITRLQIEKVNHAFESQFRITLQETQNQELNYLFRFVFRNNTNWNDLFIINPRQQSEIYSPNYDRWYNIHIFWFNQYHCISVFYDITQEKKEIKKLQETRDRYLALLEAIPDIFFVIDKEGTYEDIVFKGQAELHMDAANVIGSTIFDVGFPDTMARKIFECIHRTIENDSIETLEYAMEVNNTTLLFEMRLARLSNNAVISIARDITRRKKAEFELERAKTKAEEAVALKSRFLANLSHDIRTPMNIIIGLTKLMAEHDVSDNEKEEFINDISAQGYQLLTMIDNTIHLSKIETNTLGVNISFCNIHQLLRDLYNQFYPMIPDNRDLQIKMVTAIQHDEVGFETDPALLREVFQKLIDNALRFTTEGVIRFGYKNKNAAMVEFFVDDTGPGIPDDEKENVFLRFYVIEKDRLAQKSGPGIGLSVAQHFVAILGGELKLDSSTGKGSRFWFELPLQNPKGFMRIL
jgi:PAS domain S-box-containing protein